MLEQEDYSPPSVKLAGLLCDSWEVIDNGVCIANKGTVLQFDSIRFAHGRDFWCGGFVHFNLLWTLPKHRGQGLATKALSQLRDMSELSGCGFVAVVQPCEVNCHPRYIRHAADLVLHGRVRHVDNPAQAEQTKRLLTNAGFESGFDLRNVGNFGDRNYPLDRIFVMIPSTMDSMYSNPMRYFDPSMN